MSETIRVFWPPISGVASCDLNWPPINADSAVLVKASEYDPAAPPDADGSARRFIGAASVRVNKVAPHGPPADGNHGVTFMLEVDWSSPLNVCTEITVLDAAEPAPAQVFYTDGALAPAH
jgi:hypothetical protein